MKKLRIAGIVLILIVVFGLGTWTGKSLSQHNANLVAVPQDSVASFDLMVQAWNTTRDIYVDRTATQPQSLAYGALDGMIASLGDTGHSSFLTPEEVRQQRDFQQGQLEGVGLEVLEKSGAVVVVAPIEGSPAQRAGVRPGDIILKVDGQQITGVSDAVRRILGKAGTPVTLTIMSPSGTTKDVTLIRAKIDLISVTWRQLPGTSIAHVRLASFTRGTTDGLDKALSAIKTQGASGIILDLRDNPGGLLDESVGVASRFLRTGNVLLEKDVTGNITAIPVTPGVGGTDLPLAVLVNQGTASAAEIVSGAVQDAGRAKVIGEKTFGTGTVLGQFPLSDGSALLLATQEWLTPSGKTIWHTGLTPDEVVPLAAGATPLFPASEQDLTADQVAGSGDDQLLRALSELK